MRIMNYYVRTCQINIGIYDKPVSCKLMQIPCCKFKQRNYRPVFSKIAEANSAIPESPHFWAQPSKFAAAGAKYFAYPVLPFLADKNPYAPNACSSLSTPAIFSISRDSAKLGNDASGRKFRYSPSASSINSPPSFST